MTWNLDRDADLPVWHPVPADPDCVLAFSTRRGGTTPPPRGTLNLADTVGDLPDRVRANRERLVRRLGLDPSRLVTAGQVHGATVREVTAPGHVAACDALLTRTRGLVLAVATADCMSLLYSAPGAVAVAHAGWRGAAAGVPALGLDALCHSAGVAPGQIRVALGPCIRACCYVVGPEVAARFPDAVVRSVSGRLHLDLPAAARLQLLAAGLAPDAFDDTRACTACEPDWFFSHRRDAGITGRQWGLAALGSPVDLDRARGPGV